MAVQRQKRPLINAVTRSSVQFVLAAAMWGLYPVVADNIKAIYQIVGSETDEFLITSCIPSKDPDPDGHTCESR